MSDRENCFPSERPARSYDGLHGQAAVARIFQELYAAELKHPGWPKNVLHAITILTEEVGEAAQAAIDYTYSGGDLEHVRKELAQVGAMAIRALLHLEGEQEG